MDTGADGYARHQCDNRYVCPQSHRPALDASSNLDSRADLDTGADGYAASDLHTSPNLYPCPFANSHALPNGYTLSNAHDADCRNTHIHANAFLRRVGDRKG